MTVSIIRLDVYLYNKAVLAYKAINKLTPTYISELLKLIVMSYDRPKTALSKFQDLKLCFTTAPSRVRCQNSGTHSQTLSD